MSDTQKNQERRDGYQPLEEGYIPKEQQGIEGYTVNTSQNTTTNNVSVVPPKGGTGEKKK